MSLFKPNQQKQKALSSNSYYSVLRLLATLKNVLATPKTRIAALWDKLYIIVLIPIIHEDSVRAARLQYIIINNIIYLYREGNGKKYTGTYVNPKIETGR